MKMPGNSHIFGLIVSHMGQNGQGMVFNGEFRERESCGRSQQVVLLDECSDAPENCSPSQFSHTDQRRREIRIHHRARVPLYFLLPKNAVY